MKGSSISYSEWEKIYKSILADFGFSEEEDVKSAKVLDRILSDKDTEKIITKIGSLIKGKDVIVFGAGDSVCRSITRFRGFVELSTKISADGATSALLEEGIVPDIVVTDLDGDIDDIMLANNMGSIVVLHAHGDNIEKINLLASKFDRVVGTTQTNPSMFRNLLNFGGFTDGDRAVFLARHFKPRRIYLAGFDFDGKIGRYSFTSERKVSLKLKKLEWCRRLLAGIDGLTFL